MKLLIYFGKRKVLAGVALLLAFILYLNYCFLISGSHGLAWWKNYWNKSSFGHALDIEKEIEITKLKENTCQIPIMDPFDLTLLKFFKPIKLDCGRKNTYFQSGVNQTTGDPIIITKNLQPSFMECCYEHLIFSKLSRRPLQQKFCTLIQKNNTVIPSASQYIIINCWSTEENITDPLSDTISNNKSNESANAAVVQFPEIVHHEILFYVPKPKFEKGFERKPSTSYKMSPQSPKVSSSYKKLNVIILGFDQISRLTFIRLMRRTFNHLKYKLEAIDLQGYNKVGDATLNNTLAFMTGHDFGQVKANSDWWKGKDDSSINDTYFDNLPWIWKNFSKEGYITSYGDDYDSVFEYRFLGFKNQPTDYYLQPFTKWFLDKEISRWRKFGSYHCIGKQPSVNLLLSLTRKTSRSLRNYSYFHFIWNSRIHEDPSYPAVADKATLHTLKDLQASGELSKSIVILLSDHGWRVGPIMEHSLQARIENRMPFAFLLLPKWFREKYSKAYANLKENQYRLTTPYDIHATMLDIIDYDKKLRDEVMPQRQWENLKRNGMSLFVPVPKNRNCEQAGIDEMWCTCSPYEPFPRKSLPSKMLAQFAVRTLNSWLKPFPACVQYELDEVIYAEVHSTGNDTAINIQPRRDDNDDDYDGNDKIMVGGTRQTFRISFSVKRAGGYRLAPRFEVTIFTGREFWEEEDLQKIKMSNEVFRLSGYGVSADCMKIYSLKKICTCRHRVLMKKVKELELRSRKRKLKF